MSAIQVTIAAAVVSQLAEATLSQKIDPVRSYADLQLPLADADRLLHVDVAPVPNGIRIERWDRGSIRYSVPVDICVRQRLGQGDQDEDTGKLNVELVDQLVQMAEEIAELFVPQRVDDVGEWSEPELRACPLVDHLDSLSQFTAIIRVTCLTDKEVVDQ